MSITTQRLGEGEENLSLTQLKHLFSRANDLDAEFLLGKPDMSEDC
jgi:hypothetical protein